MILATDRSSNPRIGGNRVYCIGIAANPIDEGKIEMGTHGAPLAHRISTGMWTIAMNASMHEANGSAIRSLVALHWRPEPSLRSRFELERFGISVAAMLSDDEDLTKVAAEHGCDILLIELHSPSERHDRRVRNDFESWFKEIVGAARSLDAGVCVIIDGESDGARDLLSAGADAVAFADQALPLLAVAAFTAHNCALMRSFLKKQVHDLEEQLKQNRTVQQAKAILAEQLHVTETAALRQLRKRSRDERRPMWQLAEAIISAHRNNSDGLPTKQTDPPTS